jgi:acyl dehydratase
MAAQVALVADAALSARCAAAREAGSQTRFVKIVIDGSTLKVRGDVGAMRCGSLFFRGPLSYAHR